MTANPAAQKVHIVSLGCSRNDVDSEELAARVAQGGFELTADPDLADAVVVNTCGFIEAAKRDSIDTLLAHAEAKGDTGRVVAVGCMAQRYGSELAAELPEISVLGFDSYPDIAGRLNRIMAGEKIATHRPTDRRKLLPISPTARRHAAPFTPGHRGVQRPASGPPVLRARLESGPMAPLKIASGCDRRCAFCAIPAFRGSFLSRAISEVVEEANWLVAEGVSEVFLVSENTTSYGKDLGDIRALEKLLAELSSIAGLHWIRLSYLQPAELRPSLIEAVAATSKVVGYFDISFQHASGPLLRRMRRFGDAAGFLKLIEQVRALNPEAGIRSNFIVGFPGETEADFATLTQFVSAAGLDAIGVFGYSDEDGTEAEGFSAKLSSAEISARVEELTGLADDLVAQRAAERIGRRVEVLVESVAPVDSPVPATAQGRAAHQGPEVDGVTYLIGEQLPQVGELITAVVVAADGVDLVAEPLSA